MNHGVESFVVKRSNVPPNATSRRQIAASLKIKQTPTIHQTPQRNQSNDSSHYTDSPGPAVSQKLTGQAKEEQIDSQRGIPEDAQRFSKDGYVENRHGLRGSIHERDIHAETHRDAFDTDVGEDFDRSISDVQVSNSLRGGFRGQEAFQPQDGPGSQSSESLLEDDDDNSGSEYDGEGDIYVQDPDQTITTNKSIQLDPADFKVALRTKPEGQTHHFQIHGQHTRGNPRSRVLEELGSYPIAIAADPESVEEAQYADATESRLRRQKAPQQHNASRTRVRRSEGPGSYYGSSDEGEEHGAIRDSQASNIIISRTTLGVVAERRIYREQLDFSPTALATMTYDQLQSQSFDEDPNANPLVLPPDISSAPLSGQLAYISTLPEDQKRQFFFSLPIDSWESCGEWFVDRFAETVKKMTELRKEKRKVAIAFEEEIAGRQDGVEVKAEHLKTVMSRMHREGKVLLEEKK
ncbi:hypothetical protein GP486_008158 [Trichoglossum hirsutum]|uniref:Extracellular mutant protein 11 C-terminal domain-containing protein n=1 Tax=Trichoglossum hirsutum TaxID=265104 RepID=A0A9P8L4C2_9PEZI|nr:hypothetical protein GP486_008158 [Trichoglossum hirsutum]